MSIILNHKVNCYDILNKYHRIAVLSTYNYMKIEQKNVTSLNIRRRETSQWSSVLLWISRRELQEKMKSAHNGSYNFCRSIICIIYSKFLWWDSIATFSYAVSSTSIKILWFLFYDIFTFLGHPANLLNHIG